MVFNLCPDCTDSVEIATHNGKCFAHDMIAKEKGLQARVKELEDMLKATDEDIEVRNDEIVKLRRVVDAARDMEGPKSLALRLALRELDGEKKTVHANSQECDVCGGSECTD